MSSSRRLLVACGTALLVAGCGAPHATSSPAKQVTSSGGPTLTGKVVSITSLRGHPVVLVFWASDCGPCHDEQPSLNSAYARWSGHGVAFLGVDLLDTSRAALAFQSAFRVPYPSIADSSGTLAVAYRVPASPSLVFLSAQGKVADVVLGGLGTMSVADFNDEITTLLGASRTGSA